jgi:hypothetical protein
MKTNSVMRTLSLALLVIPMALCLVSCDDEDTTSDITPERFYIDRELTSYSDTDIYEWDTTLSVARVHLRMDDFVNGDMSIRIRDSNGRELFFFALNTRDTVFLIGDNDFEFIDTTAVGVPGLWTIELRYDNVTAETKLTLD